MITYRQEYWGRNHRGIENRVHLRKLGWVVVIVGRANVGGLVRAWSVEASGIGLKGGVRVGDGF